MGSVYMRCSINMFCMAAGALKFALRTLRVRRARAILFMQRDLGQNNTSR